MPEKAFGKIKKGSTLLTFLPITNSIKGNHKNELCINLNYCFICKDGQYKLQSVT